MATAPILLMMGYPIIGGMPIRALLIEGSEEISSRLPPTCPNRARRRSAQPTIFRACPLHPLGVTTETMSQSAHHWTGLHPTFDDPAPIFSCWGSTHPHWPTTA